jgi:predicted glycoside hydrolase/deacetylase ChbG (UPF0249 family)
MPRPHAPDWIGRSADESLLMIHADDLGLTHGANEAFRRLSHAGRVDAGSVMVPCPWFAEMAEMAAADPVLDVGVHLTLTAEKATYRWRPLTRPSATAGLVDDDGFLPRTVVELVRRAHPEAVEAELRAQIDAALSAGIDVTHLDDHMGAVFAPPFLGLTVRIAWDYRLPLLIPRSMENYGPIHNLDGVVELVRHADRIRRLDTAGLVLADRIVETDWSPGTDAAAVWDGRLASVAPGINLFLVHPDLPGAIEEIEPDTAGARIGDYQYFIGDDAGRRLEELAARRITPRALRDVLRSVEVDRVAARAAGHRPGM